MSQFDTLLKTLRTSRDVYHVQIGNGITEFYAQCDGTLVLDLRAYTPRQTLALVQDIKAHCESHSAYLIRHYLKTRRLQLLSDDTLLYEYHQMLKDVARMIEREKSPIAPDGFWAAYLTTHKDELNRRGIYC